MERTNISNVWLEAQIDENGIALTLVSEGDSEGAVVEAVDHYTFDELQDKSGDMFQMRLSDNARETLSEMRRLSKIGKIHEFDTEATDETESQEGYDLPDESDILVDDPDKTPKWSEDNRVKITEVTEKRADEYVIEENQLTGRSRTVNDANPTEPEDAPVVLGEYVSGGDKEYAFPVSRLSEL